jgi:hypothetical protein
MQVMVIAIRWQSDDLSPHNLSQDVSTKDEVLILSACPIIPVNFFTVRTSYRHCHQMAERWHAVVRTNLVTRWQSNGKVPSHSPSCRISNVALHRHREASSLVSAFGSGGELVRVVYCDGSRKHGD